MLRLRANSGTVRAADALLALAVAALSTLLAGLLPAWLLSVARPADALPKAARVRVADAARAVCGTDSSSPNRARRGAVVGRRTAHSQLRARADRGPRIRFRERLLLQIDPTNRFANSAAYSPCGPSAIRPRCAMPSPPNCARSIRRAAVCVATVEQRLEQTVAVRRLQTFLLTALAAAALILAVIGVYGLIHHAVATRTQEIGIRIALGATRRSVLWTTLSGALGLAATGLALGWLASSRWAARSRLSSMRPVRSIR